MGLFSKFKKEKTAVDWSNAYTATPKFYAKPDGSPFGAIALTEGTYGYEITNSKGEKSTYADALWIDTVLPISQIERYIEKSGVAEPSNISFVGDSDECGNYKVWIIAQEENNPHIIELTDRKKIDHMIILYWD